MKYKEITISNVKYLFSYCDKTGFLFWKVHRSNRAKKGDRVGSVRIDACGIKYMQTIFCNKYYLVHRIIWLYVHGVWPDKIDHINGDGTLDLLMTFSRHVAPENQQKEGLGSMKIMGQDKVV